MKISIIIPVYNAENYLILCLDSVLKQTYPNWELIIVDDGSTDGSLPICKEYALKDLRIKVVESSNQGPSNARNLGMSNASGTYLMFMDSDDYIEAVALKTLQEIAQSTEPDIIFYPNYTDKIKDGAFHAVKDNRWMNLSFHSNKEFLESYRGLYEHGYLHPVWNKLYKKSFIEDCRSIFPKGVNVSEDYIFNLKLYKNLNRAILIDQPLYHYVSRYSGSITSSFNPNRFKSSKMVYQYSMGVFEDWNTKELNHAKNAFISDVNVCINNLFNKDCNWGLKEKIHYIRKIVTDPSVRECLSAAETKGLRNKVTAIFVKNRLLFFILLMGKTTRWLGEVRLRWKIH